MRTRAPASTRQSTGWHSLQRLQHGIFCLFSIQWTFVIEYVDMSILNIISRFCYYDFLRDVVGCTNTPNGPWPLGSSRATVEVALRASPPTPPKRLPKCCWRVIWVWGQNAFTPAAPESCRHRCEPNKWAHYWGRGCQHRKGEALALLGIFCGEGRM
jgi:hypothetical protein